MSYHQAIEKKSDRANTDSIIQASSHLKCRKDNGEGAQRDYLVSQVIQGFKVIQAFKGLQARQVFRDPPDQQAFRVRWVPKDCRVSKVFPGNKAYKVLQVSKGLQALQVRRASKDYLEA